MDNHFDLEVQGESQDRLLKTLELTGASYTAVIMHKTFLELVSEYDGKQAPRMNFPATNIAQQAYDWIHKGDGPSNPYCPSWPKQPDTDGDVEKGWLVKHTRAGTCIYPQWIVCGK